MNNGSSQLTVQNSILFDNANAGLNITDAASSTPIIRDNQFFGDASDANRNQDYGVFARSQDPTVLRNQAYHNNGRAPYGIYLENVGVNVTVQDNLFWNNTNTGLVIYASSFEVSGNVARDNGEGFYLEDTTGSIDGLFHDNLAFGNSGNGVQMRGWGQHYNNEAYDNATGFNAVNFNGVVHDNKSWRNTTGFAINSGTLRNNRAYGNTTGIFLNSANINIIGNKSYDNVTGILAQPFGGANTIANNLVYDNSGRGIQLDNAQGSSGAMNLTNNTVMELASDALQITGNSQNISLKNNIFWSGGVGHYVLNVADSAQRGFSSDYNDLYYTSGAKVGFWQNPLATLADWRYELGLDAHSLSTDPQFVSPSGTDGIQGLADFGGLKFEYFPNNNFSGLPTTTLFDRVIDFGQSFGAFRNLPGPGDNQSYRWTGEIYLQSGITTFWIQSNQPQRLWIDGSAIIDDFTTPSRTERTASFTAPSSGWYSIKYEAADTGGATMALLQYSTPDNATRRDIRAFEAPAAGPSGIAAQHAVLRYQSDPTSIGVEDNFHLSSTAGSFHTGGIFTPPDLIDSPAIDAGDPASSFSNETPSNGGRINLGYEGNTAEASKSRAQLVQLLSFVGGEKVRQGQASLILWRSRGFVAGERVNLDFSSDGGLNFNPIAVNEINDGAYAWNPATITAQGIIRIRSAITPSVADQSKSFIVVGAPGHAYYVNDGSMLGNQYTTAAGNNANSGTTPADPMASLNALLNAYDLSPLDTIYVDTGLYNLVTNVRVLAEDSGVTITGPTTPTLLGSEYQNVVGADSPYAYYRLGEAAGTTAFDATSNHRDGTFVNGVVLGQPGAVSGNSDTAMRLDGTNDFVQLPSGFADFSNGITMEAWVNPTNQANFSRIFNLGSGQGNDLILVGRYSTTADTLFVQTYNGTTAGTTLTFGGILDLNRWTHLAVSITQSGSVQVYKNGRLVGSGQTAALRNVTRTSNTIGKSDYPTDAYFAGGIDEAAIYDKTLSADRIASHFYTATGQGALLNRGNNSAGRNVIELTSATDVTIRNLQLTGAESGLVATDADRLNVTSNTSYNNALYGFYVNTDVEDAVISGNIAYGTTGSTDTDQDTGFYLRGTRMTVNGNTAYKVGNQVGNGIYIDTANQLSLTNNLTYNNAAGITVFTPQASISGNETRNNGTGMLVSDSDGVSRSQVFNNNTHDNATGLQIDGNVEAHDNTSRLNTGAGILMTTSANDNTWAHDNYVIHNATGIQAAFGRLFHNRIMGNTGSGILLPYSSVLVNANSVYGNSVGIEVAAFAGNDVLTNNTVYDNANQGIYVHATGTSGSAGAKLINNTVFHDTGSAIKLENNGPNINLYNNIIQINGGFGIEVIGGVTGYDSNYNDIFLGRPGANTGRYLGATAVTLANWKTTSGKDAASIGDDPQFLDLNGADNLFGWEQPDATSQFADFGTDDNFHLHSGSKAIDAADSDTGAPALDSDSLARKDDLGTTNTGNGVFRFYDMGSYEFQGSSADITPPTIIGLAPVGIVDGVLSNAHVSSLIISFSEPLDAVSAVSASLYSVIEAGPNGAFGNPDDVTIPISNITYTPGSTDVRVFFNSQLPDGIYRLTISGAIGNAVVDQAGNAIDGDSNGTTGGNFVRSFQLDVTPPTVVSVTPSGAVAAGPTQFTVVFNDNRNLSAATVTSAASYQLFSSSNATFGDADDVNQSALISNVGYVPGTKTATITLTGALPAGRYQLILRPTITDEAGNQLNNGIPFPSQLLVDSVIAGSSGDDTYYIRLNPAGTNVEIFENPAAVPPTGNATFTRTLASLTTLTFNTLAGNDKLIVDFINGNPIPTGGISYDGGAQSGTPGDSLVLIGTPATSGSYTPSGTVSGDGAVTVAGKSINFTGLEPVTTSGFGSFSLITPNSVDNLTIASPLAGQTRVSGTSGGVAMEALNFFNIATVIIDTAANDAVGGGSGNDSITIDTTGASAPGLNVLNFITGSGANTLTINGSATLTASTTATLAVTVNNSAVVNLADSQTYTSLSITGAARVNLLANGNRFLKTSGLTISATAGLNLVDNDLIFQSTAGAKTADLAALTSLITTGRAGGAWNGNGISSSAAAADSLRSTTLGVIVNDAGGGIVIRGALDGQTVDANTILIKYTYTGDTDFDGDIDPDDYAHIDAGLAAHLTGYRNGDFNFTGGQPNSDDYFQIDRAFHNQAAPLSAAVAPTPAFAASSTIISPTPTKKATKKPAKPIAAHSISTNVDVSKKSHKPKKKHWADRFQF
ncbi:MAG TPA: right-handed parallel beta-helix repeat-containing protein [Tepidisphaeraceae bacterium]|nr:right-handed parallel beta-helix repeat-containing protein [Tepidisphaeraceae bacterium]